MTLVDRDLLRRWALPEPGIDADKESRGRVLVVGGSREVPGAVLLAGLAALRVGAGKLRLATVESAAIPLALAVPEARVYSLAESRDGAVAREAAATVGDAAAAVDAVVVGPGMNDPGSIVDLIAAVAAHDRPAVVLDAAALFCIEGSRGVLEPLRGRLVLTPNESEMEAMTDQPLEDFAAELGAVVSRKGPTTITASPDGECFEDSAGNPGLGTSGSGDIVAGAVAGLLARGVPPLQATVWGNHLHAVAGERLAERVGPIGFLAREIVDELPRVLTALTISLSGGR